MKLHPREQIVLDAQLEFSQFKIKWLQKHDLTYGEIFSILAGEIASTAKYAVRAERHPDNPDKPGGIE